MTMAAVAVTAVKRYTNTVEYFGAEMTALDDYLEAPGHSGEYAFAVRSTGNANFKVALESAANGSDVWFTLDESKTINAEGSYVYSYTGKVASRIRIRISQIDSGTPSVMPAIGICYKG
jgi:hypothetical protein